MEIKVSVFVAISIDGHFARKDGNIDWLNMLNKKESEIHDFGYSKFINSIDWLVTDRNTFE